MKVLGSTGNVYDVDICHLPTCSCPDFQKGNLCKHIIFILCRVLSVSSTSNLIYQNALLSCEIESIFLQADKKGLARAYQANQAVVDAAIGKATSSSDEVKPVKTPEGDCVSWSLSRCWESCMNELQGSLIIASFRAQHPCV